MRSPIGVLLSLSLALPAIACGSSSSDGGASVGDACSTSAPCGDGAICDMTANGGPVCIGADGDVDNDGIPNNLDFCEHLAGGKFDEDADGIGDECDRCPIAKPPSKPDTDHDEVDSPCDPHPDQDGDKIVFFTGFNDGAFPAKFTASAAWKVVGGTAIMTPTDAVAREEAVISVGSATGNMAIMTSYRIDALAPGAKAADAAVFGLSNLPMSGKVTADCGGSRLGEVDTIRLQTDAGSQGKTLMNLFDPAGAYRVVENLEGVTAECAVVGGVAAQQGAVTTTSSGNPPTQAGLFARGATTRFSYLLVVER